jgi:GntR family transcriptional regulator / MocR family aminotransferase
VHQTPMVKRPPLLKMPRITLGTSTGIRLHRQVYVALRDSILAGEPRKGERLLSSRALAKTLGVSRNTVLNAYDRLAEEGYVVAKVGLGTCVAANIPHNINRGSLQAVVVSQPAISLAAILKRSHYPLWHAALQDWDGNALYLYNSKT